MEDMYHDVSNEGTVEFVKRCFDSWETLRPSGDHSIYTHKSPSVYIVARELNEDADETPAAGDELRWYMSTVVSHLLEIDTSVPTTVRCRLFDTLIDFVVMDYTDVTDTKFRYGDTTTIVWE